MLLSLGILSHRSQMTEKAWCVSVSGASLPHFVERIGFSSVCSLEPWNTVGIREPDDIQKASDDHYFYDTVVSVEVLSDEVEMYDIEVEGDHSFVAGAGFVCHNSQGSEYPACVIAVHTQHYMMLQRNLVYTGLTRARKFAVFVGAKRALQMAVRNRNVVPRFTRLSERIQMLAESLGPNTRARNHVSGESTGDLPTPPLPGRLF